MYDDLDRLLFFCSTVWDGACENKRHDTSDLKTKTAGGDESAENFVTDVKETCQELPIYSPRVAQIKMDHISLNDRDEDFCCVAVSFLLVTSSSNMAVNSYCFLLYERESESERERERERERESQTEVA